MGKTGFIIVLILAVLTVVVILLPRFNRLWLNLRAEEVTITQPSAHRQANGQGTLDLKIVTVLGKDGIPAILAPEFLSADLADLQMRPEERVLGVSIDRDHRAYPLNMLSRHEIVNDTVGGVPIAVTW